MFESQECPVKTTDGRANLMGKLTAVPPLFRFVENLCTSGTAGIAFGSSTYRNRIAPTVVLADRRPKPVK